LSYLTYYVTLRYQGRCHEKLCYGTVPTSMLLNIMKYYMTIKTFIKTIFYLLPSNITFHMTRALARVDGLVLNTKGFNMCFVLPIRRQLKIGPCNR